MDDHRGRRSSGDDRSSKRNGSMKDGDILFPRYYPDWYNNAYVSSWERENGEGEGHYHPSYEYHFRDPNLYDNTYLGQRSAKSHGHRLPSESEGSVEVSKSNKKLCGIIAAIFVSICLIAIALGIGIYFGVVDPSRSTSPDTKVQSVTFQGSLVINRTFTSGLNDSNSTEYRDLAKNVTLEVDNAYKSSSLQDVYGYSNVTGFSSGSIVAHVQIHFIADKSSGNAVTSDSINTTLNQQLMQSNSSFAKEIIPALVNLIDIAASTTPEVTTRALTTQASTAATTTNASTTQGSTTASPTTQASTNMSTTQASTAASTTQASTTAASTTQASTAAPTTNASTTAAPTTLSSTTSASTSNALTNASATQASTITASVTNAATNASTTQASTITASVTNAATNASTSQASTTASSTTQASTTASSTTQASTTASSTTQASTNASTIKTLTTAAPTTNASTAATSTTQASTAASTTKTSTTVVTTTQSSTTAASTTQASTNASTTKASTTAASTTNASTTAAPTTQSSTTATSTTLASTAASTTKASTTVSPTTQSSTPLASTTQTSTAASTTRASTTAVPTTNVSTTQSSSTAASTTKALTNASTTQASTDAASTTQASTAASTTRTSTTAAPTTQSSSTAASTTKALTNASTTQASTTNTSTNASTTQASTTAASTAQASTATSTTKVSTMVAPTTNASSTATPTNNGSTTAASTPQASTNASTTKASTAAASTTATPSTQSSTTTASTTKASTNASTIQSSTTAASTTQALANASTTHVSTIVASTPQASTNASTTQSSTTAASTPQASTAASTTKASTNASTTQSSTTAASTPQASTTAASTTKASTNASTTQSSTTTAPATQSSTTAASTTQSATTPVSTTNASTTLVLQTSASTTATPYTSTTTTPMATTTMIYITTTEYTEKFVLAVDTVNLNMTLNQTFDEKLRDENSTEFQTLKNQSEAYLTVVLKANNSTGNDTHEVDSVQVLGFENGSLIIKSKIIFRLVKIYLVGETRRSTDKSVLVEMLQSGIEKVREDPKIKIPDVFKNLTANSVTEVITLKVQVEPCRNYSKMEEYLMGLNNSAGDGLCKASVNMLRDQIQQNGGVMDTDSCSTYHDMLDCLVTQFRLIDGLTCEWDNNFIQGGFVQQSGLLSKISNQTSAGRNLHGQCLQIWRGQYKFEDLQTPGVANSFCTDPHQVFYTAKYHCPVQRETLQNTNETGCKANLSSLSECVRSSINKEYNQTCKVEQVMDVIYDNQDYIAKSKYDIHFLSTCARGCNASYIEYLVNTECQGPLMLFDKVNQSSQCRLIEYTVSCLTLFNMLQNLECDANGAAVGNYVAQRWLRIRERYPGASNYTSIPCNVTGVLPTLAPLPNLTTLDICSDPDLFFHIFAFNCKAVLDKPTFLGNKSCSYHWKKFECVLNNLNALSFTLKRNNCSFDNIRAFMFPNSTNNTGVLLSKIQDKLTELSYPLDTNEFNGCYKMYENLVTQGQMCDIFLSRRADSIKEPCSSVNYSVGLTLKFPPELNCWLAKETAICARTIISDLDTAGQCSLFNISTLLNANIFSDMKNLQNQTTTFYNECSAVEIHNFDNLTVCTVVDLVGLGRLKCADILSNRTLPCRKLDDFANCALQAAEQQGKKCDPSVIVLALMEYEWLLNNIYTSCHAGDPCTDLVLMAEAWKFGGCSVRLEKVHTDLCSAAFSTIECVANFINTSKEKTCSQNDIGMTLLSKLEEILLMAAVDKTAVQEYVRAYTGFDAESCPGRGTLCPIETFSMLLQGNCTAPLGVMHNPETTESEICGAYEDLLECLAFHMMLAGMNQCKMEAINNIIFQNFTSVVYTSSGRSLTQNCQGLNFNVLQARIPSLSVEAICGSIPVIQYYVKYLACQRQLDVFASYNGSRHCGAYFGIVNGLSRFFHTFGLYCEYTKLMRLIQGHEANSTQVDKIFKAGVQLDQGCQNLYDMAVANASSNVRCELFMANYSCEVFECAQPSVTIRNKTIFDSSLKCSVYYLSVKCLNMLMSKYEPGLICNYTVVGQLMKKYIDDYSTMSAQNSTSVTNFTQCTALDKLDQLGDICESDTLVALASMTCPEYLPMVQSNMSMNATHVTPIPNGQFQNTSQPSCSLYQNLVHCGQEAAANLGYQCRVSKIEMNFQNSSLLLMTNILPQSDVPSKCSLTGSLFNVKIQLNMEWTDILADPSSPQHAELVGKIGEKMTNLLSGSQFGKDVESVRVISIGSTRGKFVYVDGVITGPSPSPNPNNSSSVKPPSSSQPTSRLASSTPQPYNMSDRLTPPQSTLTPHNNYSQSLTTLSSRPPLNGTGGSLPPQNGTASPPIVGRRKRDTLSDGGMPLGTPMTTPPPNVIGTLIPPAPAQIIVLLELKMQADAKFTEEEVRIGLSEAVKEIITRIPNAEIIANVDLPSLSVYFSQATDPCSDLVLMEMAWRYGGCSVSLDKVRADLCSAAFSTIECVANFISSSKGKTCSQNDIGMTLLSKMEEILLMAGVDKTAIQEYVRAYSGFDAESCPGRGTLCPIETFSMLLQGNCSAPLGVMHNPETTESEICGAYADLLECLAFHMMLAGNDQCKLAAIHNTILKNLTSVIYASSGRPLIQYCSALNFDTLQARIPSRSEEAICGSIPIIQYYTKYLACQRHLDVSSLPADLRCWVYFGIVNGLRMFFHQFGFYCEYTRLMRTIQQHEANSTQVDKIFPSTLQVDHTCQNLYDMVVVNASSNARCELFMANYSCEVFECAQPSVTIRNKTIFDSSLKCSVYYLSVKCLNMLMSKYEPGLICNYTVVGQLMKKYIDDYSTMSAQNSTSVTNFTQCTALDKLDQLGDICESDTLVALASMTCPEYLPMVQSNMSMNATHVTPIPNGQFQNTSQPSCSLYQNLVHCGQEAAANLGYQCRVSKIEMNFQNSSLLLMTNILPQSDVPSKCSLTGSLFNVKIQLNMEWTDILADPSSPQHAELVGKIGEKMTNLLSGSQFGKDVESVRVISIGSTRGKFVYVDGVITGPSPSPNPNNSSSVKPPSSSQPTSRLASSTPQPYNMSDRLTPPQSTLTPHNNYSQSLTTLSSRPPLNGTGGSLPPQNGTASPPIVGRRKRDTLSDGGMPLGTPMTTPPPNVIGTLIPPAPAQIIVLLELKMQADAKFTEEEVRIGLSEAVKEIITRIPNAEIIANVDLPSLSVYFSQATDPCSDLVLMEMAWRYGGCSVSLDKVRADLCSAAFSTIECVANFISSSKGKTCSQNDIGMTLLSKMEEILLMAGVDKTAIQEYVRVYSGFDAESCPGRGTLCPIETFSMLLQGNCSAPLGVMHNPETTESEICGAYADLLECLAFHMMLAGNDQCKLAAIHNTILKNLTSVIYASSGRPLIQYCSALNFDTLQARIPSRSEEAICGSIPIIQYYTKYLACQRHLDVSSLPADLRCWVYFGIVNGLRMFFHQFGFYCEYTRLMRTIQQHEANSTQVDKIFPSTLQVDHTCQNLYDMVVVNASSNARCELFMANYSCEVFECAQPSVTIRNKTIFDSSLKCSVYYLSVKCLNMLMSKYEPGLICNYTVVGQLMKKYIDDYSTLSAQNSTSVTNFTQCTALDKLDQLGDICESDTLVALASMTCPEYLPMVRSNMSMNATHVTPIPNGQFQNTSQPSCSLYQNLVHCGQEAAANLGYQCRVSKIEMTFQNSSLLLMTNILPQSDVPSKCSLTGSLFNVKIQLNMEWTDILADPSSPQHAELVGKIGEKMTNLLSGSQFGKDVESIRVISIGSTRGKFVYVDGVITGPSPSPNPNNSSSVKPPSSSQPTSRLASSTPQPYNISDRLTSPQSTLTPHNNYSQSLTTLSSRPPLNGTGGSLPPQNGTSSPPIVGRRKRDTLSDGGMPLGTPMTSPPPNVIGTLIPPAPAQIIVLLELKMRADAKFTEEEVRIGLSEAVKEIITRIPYAEIIANVDLPSLSVYFSQATDPCSDLVLMEMAWRYGGCSVSLDKVRADLCSAAFSTIECVANFISSSKGKTCSQNDIGMTLLSKMEEILLMAGVDKTAIQEYVRAYSGFNAESCPGRGTLCPIETFSILLQGNCSAPLGVMHNPETTESEICGAYADLLECLAFHMMLAGNDQCKMAAIHNTILKNLTSVVYASSGRPLIQYCSALNFDALQARIPSRSEEAICGSIPIIQYYTKYLACQRHLDVSSLPADLRCWVYFGIVNGLRMFFHQFGFYCEYIKLMRTIQQHEANSTQVDKIFPSTLQVDHTCQNLYDMVVVNASSNVRCELFMANYSCEVFECAQPSVTIRNKTIFDSSLKCSVYYQSVKCLNMLMSKYEPGLICNYTVVGQLMKKYIDDYSTLSAQNSTSVTNFTQCTALDKLDQLGDICESDTLVALASMTCPEYLPMVRSNMSMNATHVTPIPNGQFQNTSQPSCSLYQNLVHCGQEAAANLGYQCRVSKIEMTFQNSSLLLMTNILPQSDVPSKCSLTGSLFNVKIQLNMEWTDILADPSSPQHAELVGKIGEKMTNLLSGSQFGKDVESIRVISIGSTRGKFVYVDGVITGPSPSPNPNNSSSVKPPSSSQPTSRLASSTPQPYNMSDRLTSPQSTLTPHNNYSQSLTTLSSRPPLNGTGGSLPPQNGTSSPPIVGRRKRDTLSDGGMPLGTPMTTPPPSLIGTPLPPAQIIVLLELKMRADAKFTEEEVRIGLSEAVKEIITRIPYAEIIANVDLPSLSVYFSQATDPCSDLVLMEMAWRYGGCSVSLDKVRADLCSAAISTTECVANFIRSSKGKTCSQNDIGMTLLSKMEEILLMAGVDKTAIQEYVRAYSGFNAESCPGLGTLCPIETFSMLLQGNCSAPLGVMHNPETTESEICGAYADLLECLAFHMMLAGNDQCKMGTIHNTILKNLASVVYASSGRPLIQNCSALNFDALQARIPSRSEEAVCGSIPIIQYYTKYLACQRHLDVSSLPADLRCWVYFGIVNGLRMFFHQFGFYCEYTKLMRTIQQHEANSTQVDKIFPSTLQVDHTCQNLYDMAVANASSNVRCELFMANYSCEVFECAQPSVTIRNKTIFDSSLKCSVYYLSVKCLNMLMSKYEPGLICNYTVVGQLMNKYIDDYSTLSAQNSTSVTNFTQCTALDKLDQLGDICESDTLVALASMTCPEYLPMVRSNMSMNATHVTPIPNGQFQNTSQPSCSLYQNLVHCGQEAAANLGYQCRVSKIEMTFQNSSLLLMTNILPQSDVPSKCSLTGSLFSVKIQLNMEWKDVFLEPFSAEHKELVGKLYQMTNLLSGSQFGKDVESVRVISIGSVHGKFITVDDMTTRNSTPPPSTSPMDGFGSGTPSPSPNSRTNTSLSPPSSPPPFNGSGSSSPPPSPPFNGSGSSTSSPSPQPYNMSDRLTSPQSTLTPHNNYSQSLTTLPSQPPLNGTGGSLPPQNGTSPPPPPTAVGRRRRDTLLDGGMPIGTPMTTPPPSLIGTPLPPAQIIVLLELKMRADAKFTEEEVRIGLSEAVKEIITRIPYAEIIANVDLPSLSVYFSQANKCQDPNLIRSAWSEQVCQADLRTLTSGDRFIMCREFSQFVTCMMRYIQDRQMQTCTYKEVRDTLVVNFESLLKELGLNQTTVTTVLYMFNQHNCYSAECTSDEFLLAALQTRCQVDWALISNENIDQNTKCSRYHSTINCIQMIIGNPGACSDDIILSTFISNMDYILQTLKVDPILIRVTFNPYNCTSSKPGFCPVSLLVGTCAMECTSDYACNGSQKCCSNNCGYTCQNPVSKPQCPAEMFKTLIYTNCSGPYNHLQNPSVPMLDGCRFYEDLLQCIAFHMKMSGNNMCTVELINHMFMYQYSNILTRSNGTFLANCTNTDFALLQAEIPGPSSEEMCSSIPTMRYYMKYVACHLNFSVNLTDDVQCGIAFGILNGIQSFFHGFGFNCDFTQLISTVGQHEQNSTLQNKLLPPYLLKSLHTCQDVYFNGSLSNNSRLQCAQIVANYSCPVVESLNPLIKMRNTTVYTSDLKCSVYYAFIKRMKTLLNKTSTYLPCTNEMLKTMVNGFIEGYGMESGQNMVQAPDFEECTALETVDQMGSLCNKDTLVALSVMFCPIKTQSESIPIISNPTTADQWNGSTQGSSGVAVSTSLGEFCYTYQSLLQCGLQIANMMDFESEVNCSHGDMEILFERVERDNYGLLSNSLPGGLDPVHCSNYSSIFIIELKLNQEWTESLNNVSSAAYMGMIQKIQQSIDQLVNGSFLSNYVAEVKVIQIGNWSGWMTPMQTDVNLTVKMKSTARLQPEVVSDGLIQAITEFTEINSFQEIIPKINLLFINVQPVYSEPSTCTPETFKDLEGTACHQFVNISLLTEERKLCRMYIDLLKCFRLRMLLYHEGDCTFNRIDRIVMATDNNVFSKKEGFIRSYCNSYFNLTTEEHILPAEGAVCSSTDMIQHVMSQCNANKVNMTTLDTDSLCRVRTGSISCITETFTSHNYSCDRDKIRTSVLNLPVGNGSCTAVYGAANKCDQYIMENYQVANHCGIMMFYMTKSIIMKKSDLMCKVYYEFLNCVHNAGSVSSFCSDLEMLNPIARETLKLIYRTDANLNSYFDLPDFSNCTELANATVGNICQDPQKLTAVSLANCSLIAQMYPYPYSTCMKYNYLVSCGRETASILGSVGCDLETVHKAFTNNSALVKQQFPNESFSHCVVDQCLSMENLPRISEALGSCGILQLWSKLTSQQSFLDFLFHDQDMICRLLKITTDCLVHHMSQLVGVSCNPAAMRDLITNNIQNLNQNLSNALQVCPVTTTDLIPVCEDKPFISKIFLAVNEYILYYYIHNTMAEDLCMLNNVLINSTILSLWSYSGVNCTSLQIREALVNQTRFLSKTTNITDISRCIGTDACSDPLLDVCEGMNMCANLTYDQMPDCTTWLGTLKYIQLQTQKAYGLKCPLESLSKAYYRLTKTDAQKCLVTTYHEVTYALNRTWDPFYKDVASYFIQMFMYEILNEVKMALAIKTSYLSALTITDFSEFEVIGNGTMMVKVHMIAGFSIAFSDVQIQQIFNGGILARQTNTSADPIIQDILTRTITVSNQTFTPDQNTAFCRDPSILERVGNRYCNANWTGFCSDSSVQYQIVSCVYNNLRSVQANCSFRDVSQTLVSIPRISKSCLMLVKEGPRCSAMPDPDNCTATCTADEYCNDGKLCCASSSCASTVCMKPDVEGFCNTSDNIAAVLMLEECGIQKYIPDGLSPFPDNQTKCAFLMNATQCLLRDPLFSEICNVTEVVSRIISVPAQLTSLLRGLNVSQNLFGTDFNHSVCASYRNMTGNITVYRYSGILTLERDYQPELLNRSSLQFRDLDTEIIRELNRTFHSGYLNRTYLNSSVRGFRNGSVIVYFESAFSANISINDVVNTLIAGLVSSNSSIAGEIRPNSASILNQTGEGMTACRNESLITSYIHKCTNESAFGNPANEKNCTLYFRGLACVMRPIEQTYFTYCSPGDFIRAVNVTRSSPLITVAMGNFTNAILGCPEYLYLQKLAEQETILPSTQK